MNNPKLRTAHYALINIFYFAAYCGVHAFASVFLLDRGFSNTSIGIILAVSNVLSVIMQPVTAGWIDRYERFTNRRVSMVCASFCALICAVLYFVHSVWLVFAMYALLYTLQMVYQPLIQAMNFEYIAAGDRINFGLARGLGSCGFAITSVIIGQVIVRTGIDVIEIINVAAFILGILMLATFIKPSLPDTEKVEDVETDGDLEAHNTLGEFVRVYPMFMLFVLGGTCLFFSHNALNDYLIQIITPIGGNEAIMGTMVMVAAFLELPAMSIFATIEKKIGVTKILMFSGVMFTVKSLLMLLAPNMVVAYMSQVCQIFAYALFIPGGAYLAEKVMGSRDKTKGQAYINVAITLGGVFSALVCGRILDVAGTGSMLLVATIVGAVGSILSIVALSKINKTGGNE